MTNWKEYTGSDKQIAEIMNAPNGHIVRFTGSGEESKIFYGQQYCDRYLISDITHYLICNPHPLADMIIRQAMTGQPVWIRLSFEYVNCVYKVLAEDKVIRLDEDNVSIITTIPNWNIPNAEYSFK